MFTVSKWRTTSANLNNFHVSSLNKVPFGINDSRENSLFFFSAMLIKTLLVFIYSANHLSRSSVLSHIKRTCLFDLEAFYLKWHKQNPKILIIFNFSIFLYKSWWDETSFLNVIKKHSSSLEIKRKPDSIGHWLADNTLLHFYTETDESWKYLEDIQLTPIFWQLNFCWIILFNHILLSKALIKH